MDTLFAQIIAAIESPVTKTVWLFAAGIALKKWPAIYNKWIPLLLALASGISSVLAALAGLFSEAQATIVPAVHMPTVGGEPLWKSFLFSWLIPVLVAIGTQSGVKNTREGISEKKQ